MPGLRPRLSLIGIASSRLPVFCLRWPHSRDSPRHEPSQEGPCSCTSEGHHHRFPGPGREFSCTSRYPSEEALRSDLDSDGISYDAADVCAALTLLEDGGLPDLPQKIVPPRPDRQPGGPDSSPMPLSSWVLDKYMAPHISKFTAASILVMTELDGRGDKPEYW
jgi:hypothetical protein